MILGIFESWRRKIKDEPTSWGSLLLFAGGLFMLIILMMFAPYSA